jgi:hypothetical protein
VEGTGFEVHKSDVEGSFIEGLIGENKKNRDIIPVLNTS